MWGKAGFVASMLCLIVALVSLHTASVGAQSDFRTYVPIGSVTGYIGASVPSGWLSADGQCVSRVTYSELFVAVGVTWGSCDSDNGFILPDLRGRVLVGEGDGVCCLDKVLADYGGSEQHTLSVSELPSHSHAVSDPGHGHPISVRGSGTAGGTNNRVNAPTQTTLSSNLVTDNAFTGISLSETGGEQPFFLMQPFAVANYIIWSGIEELPSVIDVTVVITFPTHTPTGTATATVTPVPLSGGALGEATTDMIGDYSLWGIVLVAILIGIVLLLIRKFRQAAS